MDHICLCCTVLLVLLSSAKLRAELSSDICDQSYEYAHFWTLCGGCGVCQKLRDGARYCDFSHLQHIFTIKSKGSCKITNNCNAISNDEKVSTGYCKKFPCVPLLGTFKCQCDPTKFGRLCQYDLGQGLKFEDISVVENILYSPFFVLNGYLTISVLFSHLGKGLKIAIETLTEKLVYNSNSKMCQELHFTQIHRYCTDYYPHYRQLCINNVFKLEKVKWVITIRIPFPGRSFDVPERKRLRLGKDPIYRSYILGMLESVKLFVHHNKANFSVFDTNFTAVNLFFSPDFSYCEPILRITEGSLTSFDLVKIATKTEVIITSMYIIDEDECSIESLRDLNIKWRFWKYSINHCEVSGEYLMDRLQVEYVVFKPFSLEVGQYKIRSNVTLWHDLKEGFSVAYSFFEVVQVDLEAVIQGGDTRNVYYKTDKLVLNGSMSKNPNLNIAERTRDLTFYWECDKGEVGLCGGVFSNQPYMIYQGPFIIDETYIFALTVKSKKFDIYKKVTQKIIMVPIKIPTLEIICRKNCVGSNFESNPEEPLYLEVVLADSPPGLDINYNFTWTYTVMNEENSKSVDEIAQLNTPSNVLVVIGNTLTQGQTYTFVVEGGADVPGHATFRTVMSTTPRPFSCKLKRTRVTKGHFGNQISCDKLLFDNLSPNYEYYDRYPNSDEKGRLLGCKKTNIFRHVAFSRGQLVVEVSNQQGMVSVAKVDVSIAALERPESVVRSLLHDFKTYQQTTDPDFKANSLSVIVDIIVSQRENFPEASGIVGSLLEAASIEQIFSFSSMKIWLFALDILATQGKNFGLQPKSFKHLSQILRELSFRLKQSMVNRYDFLNDFTTTEIVQLSHAFINVCNFLFESRLYPITIETSKEENIYTVYSNFRATTYNMMMSIDNVMSTLVLNTLPYMSPTIIRGSDITIWIKEDSPKYFYKASTNQIKNESLLGVEVSWGLSKYLTNLAKTVVLELVVFNGNPFWWNKNLKITTNAIDLKIRKSKVDPGEYISKLPYSIGILLDYFDNKETIVTGTVQQPDPSKSLEIADLQVAIHKIRAERRGQLKMKFVNLNQGEIIKVLMFYNLRPDYEQVKNLGQNITSLSPDFVKQLVDPTSEDIYDLYFIGILPGPHLPVGQWMNYSFELKNIHCVSWHYNGWRSDGCETKDVLVESQKLHCECSHLSTFAGFSNLPINSVNPFEDYKLLVHVFENPFVVVLVACLLILYFFLLFWAARKDCRDRVKQCAIYLEDNLPYDKFPYLVAVYTGTRLFAGTTSNVGIVIEGENAISRPHILNSTMFRTLQRTDDNWFILFTPIYLGKIKLIQLWTDYSGRRPEWYCNKVVVIDITEKIDYTFLVNSWISLRFGEHIVRFIKADTIENKQKRDLASDNLIFGFREGHLWFSVLSNHPRSALRTSQRLSVAFSGFFASLLVSCMFYGVLNHRIEEKSAFNLTEEQVFVGASSLLLSAVLVGTVLSVFRKSAALQDMEDYSFSGGNTGGKKGPGICERMRRVRAEKTHGAFFTRFSKVILKIIMKKKKFVPVHLDIDVIQTKKKKSCKRICWTVVAWFTCINIIITCSYFIILYGLKFGKVKSLEWLSSAFLGLGEGVFLASPTKIVFLAVLSGITFTREYEVVKYDIDWKKLRLYKKYLMKRHSDLGKKLIAVRSQRMYIPVSHEGRKEKMGKQNKLDAGWMLLDNVIIGILAVLLIIQSSTLWTTKYFWNNYQLRYLLKSAYKEEGFKTNEIQNITFYLPFLKDHVFPLIYQSEWYNGLPFEAVNDSLGNNIEYTFSGTSTLFGLPRLSQIRQKPSLCKKNIYEGLPASCPSRLTERTEDTDVYQEGWTSGGRYELFITSSPWDYIHSDESCNAIAFSYPSFKYDCRGYIVDLGLSQMLSEDTIEYLRENDWLDKRTSVVLFNLSLYNVNTGTLSWLMSITERLYIGLLINKLFVFTVNQRYKFPLIDCILLISMCTFIIRVLLFINRRGVMYALTDFWTLVEITIVWLSLSCAFLYIKSVQLTSNHLKDFQNRNREKRFQFLPLLPNLIEIRSIIMVLVVMVPCRFMKSWKFGRTFDVFFFTLISAWQSLMWILIMLIIMIFSYWKAITHILNNFILLQPIYILLHKSDFKLTVKSCVDYKCKMSPFMLSVVSLVFSQFIVLHYLNDYRIMKNKRTKLVPNIWTVLFKGKEKIA